MVTEKASKHLITFKEGQHFLAINFVWKKPKTTAEHWNPFIHHSADAARRICAAAVQAETHGKRVPTSAEEGFRALSGLPEAEIVIPEGITQPRQRCLGVPAEETQAES